MRNVKFCVVEGFSFVFEFVFVDECVGKGYDVFWYVVLMFEINYWGWVGVGEEFEEGDIKIINLGFVVLD